jgi:hypothetical protein
VSYDIAQTFLVLQEGVKTMVFTGSFMHKNDVAQKKLATSIRCDTFDLILLQRKLYRLQIAEITHNLC